VLDKLKCYHYAGEEITLRSKIIDTGRFLERLQAQQGSLELLGLRGATLYIGSQDYAALMHDEEEQQGPWMFSAQYAVGSQTRGELPCTLRRNLRVVVCPWMTGLLVVPEGFGEER